MNINRNNYEAYMIDYLDGKLDAVEVSELLLFLEQHDDIRQEFLLITDALPVADEQPVFEGKQELKKPTYPEVKKNLTTQLIAALEGDLDESGLAALERSFIVYPELKADAELVRKTKLVPDHTVVFKDKKQLKKGARVLPLFMDYAWKAAAVIAVCSMIIFFSLRQPAPEQVAESRSTNRTIAPRKNDPAATTSESKTSPVAIKEKRFEQASSVKMAFAQGRAKEKNTLTSAASGQQERAAMILLQQKEKAKIQAGGLATLRVPSMRAVPGNPVPVKPEQHTGEELFKDIPQLASEKLKKSANEVLVEENNPNAPRKTFAVSDLGLLFVKLYNKTTGDDAKVVKKYDTAGTVVGYEIIANNFEFGRGK